MMRSLLREGDLLPELLEYAKHAPEEWAQWPLNRCLWYLRKRSHLSQAQLAARAGLPRSHVARIEAGHDVRWATLRRLFSGLGFELLILPSRAGHAGEPWKRP